MARRKFNDGQEIVFQDFNKMGEAVESELYERTIFELIQRTENAFFSDGLKVNYSSPTSVTVNAGIGFQTDNTQVAPASKKRMLYRSSAPTINLTAPDGANDRIDLIVCKADRLDGSTESRKYKAPLGAISTESLVTSDDWEAEIITVDGTPAGSPSAPATPAGYIKIAELLVSAVTGLSGAGAVTDTRSLMPIGGDIDINTLAFQRVTQNASLNLKQVLSEMDANQVNGRLDNNVFTDLVTDPAAPTNAGELKLYNKGEILFVRDQAGVITPVGSGGGGGGGGADWKGDALETLEYGQKVKEYAQGGSQKETLYLKVPQGYLPGRPVTMFLNHYSPSASNEFKMQAVSSLIRNNVDAINYSANQHTDDSGDITNTVANQSRQLTLEITDVVGLINGFSVSAGDLIRVELSRIAPGGTEDTAAIKMIPTTTEVKFG